MQSDQVEAEENSGGVATEKAGEAPDSVSGLAGIELDAAIAERVMGWPVQKAPRSLPAPVVVVYAAGCYIFRNEDYSEPWVPSASIAAAMEVESRIAELARTHGGLKFDYVRHLTTLVTEQATHEQRTVEHFDWIHASAEQRCRAALAAVAHNAPATTEGTSPNR